jgi:hypothetical protein
MKAEGDTMTKYLVAAVLALAAGPAFAGAGGHSGDPAFDKKFSQLGSELNNGGKAATNEASHNAKAATQPKTTAKAKPKKN